MNREIQQVRQQSLQIQKVYLILESIQLEKSSYFSETSRQK